MSSSRLPIRHRKDLSTEMIRTKIAHRKSLSQKENRHKEYERNSHFGLKDVNIPTLESRLLDELDETSQELVPEKASIKPSEQRKQMLQKYKEEKQLRKLKEQREKAKKEIFKVGLYRPDKPWLFTSNQTAMKAEPKKVITSSVRITRSKAKDHIEPTKVENRNNVRAMQPCQRQTSEKKLLDKEKKVVHPAVPASMRITRSATQAAKQISRTSSSNTTRKPATTDHESERNAPNKGRPAQKVKTKPDKVVSFKVDSEGNTLDSQASATNGLDPDGVLSNMERFSKTNPIKTKGKISFAPSDFMFHPLDGLKSYQVAPMTPRSANAFLTPSYIWSPLKTEIEKTQEATKEILARKSTKTIQQDSDKLQCSLGSPTVLNDEHGLSPNEDTTTNSNGLSRNKVSSLEINQSQASLPEHDVPYFRKSIVEDAQCPGLQGLIEINHDVNKINCEMDCLPGERISLPLLTGGVAEDITTNKKEISEVVETMETNSSITSQGVLMSSPEKNMPSQHNALQEEAKTSQSVLFDNKSLTTECYLLDSPGLCYSNQMAGRHQEHARRFSFGGNLIAFSPLKPLSREQKSIVEDAQCPGLQGLIEINHDVNKINCEMDCLPGERISLPLLTGGVAEDITTNKKEISEVVETMETNSSITSQGVLMSSPEKNMPSQHNALQEEAKTSQSVLFDNKSLTTECYLLDSPGLCYSNQMAGRHQEHARRFSFGGNLIAFSPLKPLSREQKSIVEDAQCPGLQGLIEINHDVNKINCEMDCLPGERISLPLLTGGVAEDITTNKKEISEVVETMETNSSITSQGVLMSSPEKNMPSQHNALQEEAKTSQSVLFDNKSLTTECYLLDSPGLCYSNQMAGRHQEHARRFSFGGNLIAFSPLKPLSREQ